MRNNLSQGWRNILVVFFVWGFCLPYLQAYNDIKSKVFLSPKFVLGPGSVENKFYYGIDFPRGHIAIKSFDAEVIDETGNPVPLHETYLHHWGLFRVYGRKNTEHAFEYNGNRLIARESDDIISARNAGICQGTVNGQYVGVGSETRRTATDIPDPYGIEVGNPATIPAAGYEDVWILNVHAIDTRGVEDKLGCIECKCNLYNVTVDEYGRTLSPNYKGGLQCCHDHTHCTVKYGFEGSRRSLYLRYTVKWVDWDTSIVPVKIYILDVTDNEERFVDSTGHTSIRHHCLLEYDVEPCKANIGVANDECVHTKRTSLTMPTGGYVIYGVAHQHSAGTGAALYRKDGQVLCSSVPVYGNGIEAGNEAGYIVGMSTCYPKPGFLKITDGETLILESNYSNSQEHTGLMGLFYILVADGVPADSSSFLDVPIKMYQKLNHYAFVWGAIVLVAIAAAAAVSYPHRNIHNQGYQPIMI